MQYLAPTTFTEAVILLPDQSGECCILAGGTDLLVRMKSDMADPDEVIDIKRINTMRQITEEGDTWRIGTPCRGLK